GPGLPEPWNRGHRSPACGTVRKSMIGWTTDVRPSTLPLRGLLRMRILIVPQFGLLITSAERFSPRGPPGIEPNRHSDAGFEPLVAPVTSRFVAPSGGMGGERWQAR